jgi:hypothetical protein
VGDDIKMDLRDIRLEGVNWIHLALDMNWWQAVVDTVTNLQVPQKTQGIPSPAQHITSFSNRFLFDGLRTCVTEHSDEMQVVRKNHGCQSSVVWDSFLSHVCSALRKSLSLPYLPSNEK